MRFIRRSAPVHGLLVASLLGATSTPVAAETEVFAVHGVTNAATDPETCETSLEIGFRAEIGDLPLSNGELDPATVGAATVLVDGAPALTYGTYTDFGVAPFYFAT